MFVTSSSWESYHAEACLAKALPLTKGCIMIAPLQRELRRIVGHNAELDFIHLQGHIETKAFPGKYYILTLTPHCFNRTS